VTGWDYLYGLVLPAAVAALVVRVARGRLAGAIAVAGGFVAAWIGLEIRVPWPWLIGAAVLVGGIFGPGLVAPRTPLVWALAAVGGAGLLYTAGIASWAQLTGALAVTLAMVAVLARDPAAAVGAVVVAAVVHTGLMAAGCFRHSSDMPWWAFVAVAVLPLVTTGRRAIPRRHLV
jgi:hypothetical protein